MSEDQELFDRSLLRRRRARFAGETGEHEFLLSHVAAEIAERIGAILRDFPLALDLGAYHGLLGRAVAALPSVGEMIYAESVPALAACCPRPAVVCDEELLPFKEMSLSLVVSGLALHRVNDLPGALIQIRHSLRPDGLFMGAALGSRSLQELRQVLIEAEAVPLRNSVLIPNVNTAFAETGEPVNAVADVALRVLLEDLEWWGRVLAEARPSSLLPGVVRMNARQQEQSQRDRAAS